MSASEREKAQLFHLEQRMTIINKVYDILYTGGEHHAITFKIRIQLQL